MSEFETTGAARIGAADDRFENYAMLSRLFRSELDASLLKVLVESPVIEPMENAHFNEGYQLIRGFLDGVDDVDRNRSVLAIDYCLAFLGYGSNPERDDESTGMLAAYPYESVYVSGSKTLAGGASASVAAEYRCSGFMPTRERIVADDHIACELEYLQHLVGKELSALEAKEEATVLDLRKRELEFIESHPLAWIGAFESAVMSFAETDFYPGLVRMTRGWLEMEVQELGGAAKAGGDDERAWT